MVMWRENKERNFIDDVHVGHHKFNIEERQKYFFNAAQLFLDSIIV